MEESLQRGKVALIIVFSAITDRLSVLALPLMLLVLANIIDYATGLVAAPKRGQVRNSDKGFAGIVKKVCSWLLVVVGLIVDVLIHYLGTTLSWDVPFNCIVATLVCVWLLANELLSVLENISDITGPENIPPFLQPMVAWVKKKAEDQGEQAE